MFYNFSEFVNQNTCQFWMRHHVKMHDGYWPIILSSMVLSAVNIVTNSLAFIVFYRDPIDSVLNKLLIALSVFEVLFQQFYFIHVLVELHLLLTNKLIFGSLQGANIFARIHVHFIIPGMTASHIARNWMVVMISFFRFEVLIRTFSTKYLLFKKDKLSRIFWAVILLAVLISLPRTMERNVRYCIVENGSDEFRYTVVAMTSTKHAHRKEYIYLYTIIMLFLFQNGGPTFLVCFASVMILLKIRERKAARERLRTPHQTYELSSQPQNIIQTSSMIAYSSATDMKKAQTEESKNDRKTNGDQNDVKPLTDNGPDPSEVKCRTVSKGRNHQRESTGERLVIVLCILFCICEMPAFFTKLISGIWRFMGKPQNHIFEMFGMVANLATALDSFVNFFIYLLSNRRFRSILLQMFSIGGANVE